jgi:ribosomal protein S19E (S16A)
MTELSPQAHEILKTAYKATRNPQWQTNFYSSYAAAILRTAADQVVPEEDVIPTDEELSLQRYCQRERTRKQLLAIAAELEGNGQ